MFSVSLLLVQVMMIFCCSLNKCDFILVLRFSSVVVILGAQKYVLLQVNYICNLIRSRSFFSTIQIFLNENNQVSYSILIAINMWKSQTKAPPKLLLYCLVEAKMTIINYHLITCHSKSYNSSSGYSFLQSHMSLMQA